MKTKYSELLEVYLVLKKALFDDFLKYNSVVNHAVLYEKAKKLADRLFVIGFVDNHSFTFILQQFHNQTEHNLYFFFKVYFETIDSPTSLFQEDAVLDALEISDKVLEIHILKLSSYNFFSEIDVNVLGYIFENTLNENVGIFQNKRKKEGVFYTSTDITQYIIEKTLGQICKNKRKELSIFEFSENECNTLTLQEYQYWLENLKIIDPACGSGAFLNEVLLFFIREHKKISDIVDISKLKNNLYGIDINPKSVENTQLSLWLCSEKQIKENRNIRCENALLLNWEVAFPEIMAQGGFDVVLGNPPYIKEYTNKKAFEGLHTHYCYQGKMDLWYFFGALALEIVKKESGLIGYIAPNNWVTNSGASKFRNIILQKGKLIEFIDFADFKVFDSAGIQTMIYVIQRTDNNENYVFDYAKIEDSKINHETNQLFLQKNPDSRFLYSKINLQKSQLIDKTFHFNDFNTQVILDKIAAKHNFSLNEKEIAQGIVAPQDVLNKSNQIILGEDFKVGEGIFVLDSSELLRLSFSEKEKKYIKPFYTPQELGHFIVNCENKYWLIYTDSSFKNSSKIEEYPNIKGHLDRFKQVITSDNRPYGLHRARNEAFFIGEKILSLRKCLKPTFTLTTFDCYVSQSYCIIKTKRINQKYLTALFNSNLFAFWLKKKGKMQGNVYQIDKEPLLNLPITVANEELQAKLINLVDKIIYEKIKEKIIFLKKEINETIYMLYELSEKEIRIIEKEIL